MGDIDKLTRSRLNELDKRMRSIEAKLNIIQVLILAAHDVKPSKIAQKLEIDGFTVLRIIGKPKAAFSEKMVKRVRDGG